MLSQWQERFSADKILILPKRRSLLQTCQIDISTEKRGNERPKVSSAFSDADDSSSDASDEAGETMALISKDNSASLQNLVQKLQSFSDSDKLETPRDSSLHRTCVNDFARQTNSTEAESSLVAQSQRGPMSTGDLYSWMANEQKTMRRSKTGADLHDDSGLDVNPLHVPLGIYFGSLFNFLDLEESSNAQLAIFNHLGSKVLFSATLDSLSVSQVTIAVNPVYFF